MTKNILVLFEKEQREVLQKLDELYDAIKHLKYEGKLFRGRNMRAVEKNVNFLKKELSQHIAIDDKVIFPFLEVHIPKLEPLLHFLRAECSEFELSLKNFETLFQKLKDEEDGFIKGDIIHQLNEKGLYLICIMRNHIQMEIQSVYKPIERQLRPDEKKNLFRKCFAFMAGKMTKN